MNDEEEFKDVLITEYVPEILVIQDNEDKLWVYNVNLYQDYDNSVYRIKSQTKHRNKEDAIMDANGVIELLGFNANEKLKISCFSIEDDDIVDNPIYFDGLDFFPCDDDGDDHLDFDEDEDEDGEDENV